jgi:hypothetical protein
MELQRVLELYCLARSRGYHHEQIGLANALVDEHIPELIRRLAEVMVARNAAQATVDNALSGWHE